MNNIKLYKFRKIDNQKYYDSFLNMIKTKTLDLKHPKNYPDIFEAEFNPKIIVNSNDLINENPEVFNILNPNDKRKLKEMIKHTKSFIKNFNIQKEQIYTETDWSVDLKYLIDEFMKDVFICSLSKSWNNNKMWEDYNSYKGVCVEFNVDIEEQNNLNISNHIIYSNDIPTITLSDLQYNNQNSMKSLKNKIMFYKGLSHSYENEYRICSNENQLQLNEISRIFFGPYVDDNTKHKLQNDIFNIDPNIECVNTKTSKTKYELEIC